MDIVYSAIYKAATFYKCLHGIAPAYLTEMIVQKSTVPALSRLR